MIALHRNAFHIGHILEHSQNDVLVQNNALDVHIIDHNRPTMETVRPSLIRSKKNRVKVKKKQRRMVVLLLPREEIRRSRNFSHSALL